MPGYVRLLQLLMEYCKELPVKKERNVASVGVTGNGFFLKREDFFSDVIEVDAKLYIPTETQVSWYKFPQNFDNDFYIFLWFALYLGLFLRSKTAEIFGINLIIKQFVY